MKIKSSALVSGFLMLIGLFGIITSAGFRYWESMTLPLITSSLVFVLAGVQLIRDLCNHSEIEANKKSEINKGDSRNKDEIKRGVFIFGSSIAFVMTTYFMGFYVAVPFFSFAYLKQNSRTWLTSTLFAVIFLVFIYLVFDLLLKTPLYKGLIFQIILKI
jgi:hypothetical protein